MLMAGFPEPSRVFLDPSIVFSDEALEWIANPELRPWLAVSGALMRRLEDPPSGEAFLPYAEPDPERIVQVREALRESEVMVYSVEQALAEGKLSEEARVICDRLAGGDEPLGDVLADEWAFLTTQSLAVIWERAKHSLQAFVRAGGEVIEVAADKMRAALDEVREHIPAPVLNAMKQVDPAADRVKWLVYGGEIAGQLVPPLGLALTIAQGIKLGIVVIAGDP
jgi:hypothetical protein